jgi:hypothetical protein
MGTRATILGILPLVGAGISLGFILDGSDISAGMMLRQPSAARVVKSLAKLPSKRSRLAITFIGAPELHPAEPDYLAKMRSQLSSPSSIQHVTKDVGGEIMGKVPEVILFIREQAFESHCFTTIAIKYSLGRLFMNVDHFSFSYIGYGLAFSHDAMRPFQIFQTGKGFIKMITLP